MQKEPLATESKATIVSIDGSKGEGGGQILRNAISYANILRKNLHIYNIRAGRSKPGLKAQHLTGLQLATKVCGGKLSGDQLHSTEITYQQTTDELLDEGDSPGEVRTLKGEILTAGSICLLLQAALPCALYSETPCLLQVTGGTNASMAPQYDYWSLVFLPTLFGQCSLPSSQIEAKVLKRGFFPKGGGEVHVQVNPLTAPLKPINMTERGEVDTIYIRAFHAGLLPRHLAVEMAKAAEAILRDAVEDATITIDIVAEDDCVGSGLGILVLATTTAGCRLAGSALSSPKRKASDVGQEAANELVQTLHDGGCVDEWLQDQLVLFCALADGVSEIVTGSLTLHTRTAIWIAETMAGAKFEVTKLGTDQAAALPDSDEYNKDGRVPGRHLIRCHGVGFHKSAVLKDK